MGSGSSATQHQLNQLTSEAAAIAAGLTQEERQRIWTAVASLEVQREAPSKPSFALRSYFLKDYKGGGVFQNEEYDHHADDWCWIHKGSGIKVWADALDLTQSCCIGDVEFVFHYTTEKGFRNITDPSKQAVELFASLITEGETANAWWGKGVYSVRKAPDEWPDVATLIDNNYRNMHKRDIELKGREAADQEYRSRVAYCIPILANVAMTYDVSVQQTPEMVEKGKPAGVNLAGKLLNEPGQLERQCIVIRVEREEEVGNASAVLVDTLRCRAEAAATRVGQPATEAIVAMGRLAQVVAERGGLSEALGLRRRELAAWEAAVGAEDPRTLMAMHNLAFVLDCLGNYPEAEELLRRALEGREKHLGPEHLDTLNSLLNLGDLLTHKRQFEEAEPLYRRALEGTEAQLGPMHPHTLISVNNLAVVLKKQNKLEEAEKLHRRALEGTEAQLGPMHPDTLVYVNNLAVLLQNQNKLDEAERFFRRALEGTEAQLGATHPSTLQSVTNLAALLKEQNKLDEAEELHRAALASKESQLGPKHRSTIASFFYLADLLEAKGAFIEAEKLYLSELRGLEALHGPDAKVTRGRRRELHRFQQQHGLAGGFVAALKPQPRVWGSQPLRP